MVVVVAVVMDDSAEAKMASNSPPREEALTSHTGSLFLLLWYSIGWEHDAPLLLKRNQFHNAPVFEDGYEAGPVYQGQYNGQYTCQYNGQ